MRLTFYLHAIILPSKETSRTLLQNQWYSQNYAKCSTYSESKFELFTVHHNDIPACSVQAKLSSAMQEQEPKFL